MSERFGNEVALLKHQDCEEFLRSDCAKRPKILRNFPIERPHWLCICGNLKNIGTIQFQQHHTWGTPDI